MKKPSPPKKQSPPKKLEIEQEVMELYEKYWDTYFSGDIDGFSSVLHDNFSLIGTVEGEVFDNKAEVIEFVKATVDQYVGKFELRNRKFKIRRFERIINIVEFSDGYVKIDNQWNFYAKFRVSTQIQKIKSKWGFIHQHGSLPDMRTQEGETISIEKIKTENIELREAVKRRTIELEDKNRELEIEAALERVRARSMAMHKSEEVADAASEVFQQLRTLGASPFVCAFILIDKKTASGEIWMTDADGAVIPHFGVIPSFSGEPIFEDIYTGWKRKKAFARYDLEGEALKAHDQWVMENTTIPLGEAYEQSSKEQMERLTFIAAFFSHGYMLVASPNPFSTEEEILFQRFSRVFEQTYTRFLDLKQAESQAREAQTEAALERVRARSMAMHNSDELRKVVAVLFEQIQPLGFESVGCTIIICDEARDGMECWYSSDMQTILPQSYHLPVFDHPVTKTLWNTWKEGIPYLAYENSGNLKHSYDDLLFTQTDFKNIPKAIKAEFRSMDTVFGSYASMRHGLLAAWGSQPLTDDQAILLQRFAKVFEQTYTRFLDLKKAEEQAREAQIEAALERVRAKALAMHTSDDIGSATAVVFHELDKLGIVTIRCGITIIDGESKAMETWIATTTEEGDSVQVSGLLPVKGNPTLKRVFDAWKKGLPFFSYELKGKALERYYQSISPDLPLPEREVHHQKQVVSLFFFPEGGLYAYTAEALSEESQQIFQRFTNVFALTYRRFLDLKQAEEQAREAQIEAALERVRARTMAMHHSDELVETSDVMFQELKKMEIDTLRIGIGIMNTAENTVEIWSRSEIKGKVENTILGAVPSGTHPVFDNMVKAWKEKKPYFSSERVGDEVKDYYEKLAPYLSYPKRRKYNEREAITTFFFAEGSLNVISLEPLQEEECEIMVRFARVFGQIYRRFLDLKQAEEQAREAQIEAALERVRARSMAMHKSEELLYVVNTLYGEFQSLGVSFSVAVIQLKVDETKDLHLWLSTEDGMYDKLIHWPFQDLRIFHEIFNCWSSEKMLETTLSKTETVEFFEEYFKLETVPKERKAATQSVEIIDLLGSYQKHIGVMLMRYTEGAYTENEKDIVRRFSKVFEQTYTRFLDLQKAEEQSREAQIELGLERVRARAMAMQKSDELSELVDTVFKELSKLDFALSWCVINIFDEPTMTNTLWAANPEIGNAPESYKMKLEDYRFHHEFFQAWKARKTNWVFVMEGPEKEIYLEYMFTQTEFSRLPEPLQKEMRAAKRYVHSYSFSNFGGLQTVGEEPLSEENLDILSRFGKVFDLTYTRFNDLQQAEAQAREAQIEAALERIRARTMAMHRSDELHQAAAVLYEQFYQLGVTPFSCGYVINDDEKGEWKVWMTTPNENAFMDFWTLPMEADAVLKSRYESWKNKEDFHYSLLEGEENLKHAKVIAKYAPWGEEVLEDFPPMLVLNSAHFSHGHLCVVSPDRLSSELEQTLCRFAKVFEQTYIRFLDLQKAEAQAREAQIEAALERVRARTMAMHHSSELAEAASVAFQQFADFGLVKEWDRFGFSTIDPETGIMRMWITEPGGAEITRSFDLPLIGYPWIDEDLFEKWKALPPQSRKEHLEITVYTGQQLLDYMEYLVQHSEFGEDTMTKEHQDDPVYDQWVTHNAWFSHGSVGFYGVHVLDSESQSILQRFARVFEQTYTRFLDLQQAEAQAREAQIEAALERIRSQATSMQQSLDLLDVVVTMRNEFISLGHEAHYFWHMLWSPDKYEKAMTSGDGTRIGMIMELPRHIHGDIPLLAKWEKSDEPLVVYTMNTDGAIDYVDKMINLGNFKQVDPNAPSHDDIRHIGGLTFIMARTAHGEIGYSLPGAVPDPPAEDLNILVRFAGAFDLAHRRFLDLQQAETQSRETQIELALERVRARSMAMHQSDELREVVATLFDQIKQLGYSSFQSAIIIYNESEKSSEYWLSDEKKTTHPVSYHIPYTGHPILRKKFKLWKQGEKFIQVKMTQKAKQSFDRFAFEESEFKNMPKAAITLRKSIKETIFFSNASMRYGVLEAAGRASLTDEHADILQRFANVFEQTYTRFLDLKQAEEQAREAQIEASLERVRAASMAMHNSEELINVATVMYGEFSDLGMTQSATSAVVLIDEKNNRQTYWGSQTESNLLEQFEMPLLGHPILQQRYDAWKSKKPIFVQKVGGKKLREILEFVLPEDSSSEEENVAKADMPDPTFFYCGNFSHGYVHIIAWKPLSEEQESILLRFTRAFQMTYTRFLDLQKAEEQAREAQIEAALERVRASMMAMHKSDELREVIASVFEQMKSLGFDPRASSLGIYKDDLSCEYWLAGFTHEVLPQSYTVPYCEHRYYQDELTHWKKGFDFKELIFEGNDKAEYDKWLFKNSDFKNLPAAFKKEMTNQKRLYISNAYMKYGFIEVVGDDPASEETISVIKRFAKVFEQCYTRFVDLQKAEAQAREARVEAALEKVRSRAMGMQHSDELAEISFLLDSQVRELGIKTWGCAFHIYQEKDSLEWFSNENGVLSAAYRLPREDVWLRFYEAAQRDESLYIEEFKGEDCVAHYEYLCTIPGVGDDLLKLKESGGSFPTFQIDHAAFFKYGHLLFITFEPVPEAHDTFKRFAKVFEQAYTRFLDLKQAEEQAREAQIEVALERVRARTMAMQQSSELSEAGNMVFQQMRNLGIRAVTSWFWFIDLENNAIEIWTTHENKLAESVKVKASDLFTFQRELEAWKNHESFLKLTVPKLDFIKSIRDIFGIKIDDKESATHFHLLQTRHKYGFLGLGTWSEATEEEMKISARFASVFEQTYTRFLDLQKAEAQAREAQIEAALERVRASTMAMHQSDELRSAIATLFEQLRELDFDTSGVSFVIFDKADKSYTQWMAGFGKEIYPENYHVPYFNHPYYNAQLEGWQQGEKYSEFRLDRALKDSYGEFVFEHSDFKKLPQEVKDAIMLDDVWIMCNAFMSHGAIEAVAVDEPISTEQAEILQRFAIVFEQTYTRFLDLQKAEAQAREAQIEAALERVRSRTMGMQRSDELAETASLLFTQVSELGVHTWSSGFQIWNTDKISTTAWMAAPQGGIQSPWMLPHTKDTFHKKILDAMQRGEDFFVFESGGKSLEEVYRYMMTLPGPKEAFNDALNSGLTLPKSQITHCGFFSHGYVMFITLEPNPEVWDIFKRFAKVFEQTYTRFLDLQKAEAQAHQAVQQASLDRVRAEIASMRTTKDLRRITPLIWRELTTLEVPFFRCGMFIIDEATDHVKVYLSTPSGESLAALNLKFDFMPLVEKTVEYWRQRKVYREEWDREQFIKWTQAILSQGLIKNPKKYQEDAPANLVIQLVPFTQGMLYVGSKTTLSDDEITLTASLADAFSVAYARYEDFQKLEMAKKAVESSFKDLGLLSKELESKNTLLEDENQRKARELEEARQLQLSMLPKDIPKVPGLDIAVYMKTATEVGGDYYDFHIDENNALTVVIGDATGHGLKAGTMVTTAKTLFSALAKNPDILSTFEEMNSSIKSMKLPLLSMCLAMLKFNNGTMKLSSAGIPPVVIHRNASKKLEELTIDGMPLGAMKGFPYREKELSLEPGDAILMMSDGFPELMNDKEEMLDYLRAYEAFKKTAGKSSREIIRSLVKTGLDWANGRPQDDDITFVVLKVMK